MKRIVLLASLAAALVASADYKDWATPENQQAAVVGLKLKIGTGTIDTNFTEDPATVKPENIYNSLVASIDAQEIPQNAKNAFTLAAGAMAQAIHAAMTARLNEKKIDQLSASVESLVGITAADKVDASGNVISKGNIDEMRSKLLAKKQSIAKGGSSSTGEGSSAQPIQIKVTEFNYDTKEFEQIVADSKSKMGIKGFKDLTGSESGLGGASSWALAGYNWYLPTANSKDDNIYWRRWNGWNQNVFSAGDDTEGGENSEQLRLRNWNGGSGGCDLTFQKMLTDAEDPDYASARGTHTVLTRVNDGGTYKLHYMSFDSSTIGGRGFGVDDMSVTTNTANGAVSQGVLSLYGYADAEEEAASSETEVGYIPYVDGSEELGWCGFSEFFNENVFTTDDDGKIILNGIEDAEEDDIMVVTAKGASGSQEVSVKKLDGDVFAADTDSKVSLSGWGDTATTYLFEDEDDDATIEVPVKAAVTGGSELQWRVVGGIDHTFFEIDADTDHQVAVKGWNDSAYDCEDSLDKMLSSEGDTQNRQHHAFLARYNTGSGDSTMHWVSINNVLPQAAKADETSITTNTANGAVTQGQLSIYGFADAQEAMEAEEDECGYIPYVGTDGALDWTGFSTFFNENVFALDSDGHIILAGMDDLEDDDIAIVTATGEDTEQTISVSKLDGGEFEKDSDDKLTLKGWGDTHDTYLFASSSDDGAISIPVETGSGDTAEIGWRKVGGIDTGALEVDATSNKVTLKGFNTTAADCGTTLTSMLTDEADEDNRDTHELLARYSGGDNDTVHWVKIGDMIEIPDVLADNCTITTNSEYGAVEDGKLSLYDFETANDGATEDNEPYIPYADGEDTLGWAAFSSFFADSVFKKSETTGKILLNGTTEEGKVKVLTLAGTGDEGQTLSTLGFDNASVDGNVDAGSAVQLHAFATAPSPYSGSQNFADALTNTQVAITQMSVPVRVPDSEVTTGFSVKYIPMGKVTGIPAAAVDQKTITIDEEDADNKKLQIIGAKTAEKGYVLQMGDEHTAAWKKVASDDLSGVIYPQGVGSGEERHEPIEITDHNDGTYGVGLRNWDTETQDFLYGSKDAIPSKIEFDETIELNDDGEIELAGYSDAQIGSMSYKSSEGLEWLELPNSGSALLSLTKNSTPEAVKLGESFQKETVASEKVVNIKNFTSGGNCEATLGSMLTTDSSNRSKHQIMSRFFNGGTPSVHWVSIGEIASGGSACDGHSITTNTTDGAVVQGKASVFGFSTASTGSVPHKTDDGKIEWKAAGGGSITIKGDYDTTEVVATNKIEFIGHQLTFKVSESGGATKVEAYPSIGNFSYDPMTHAIKAGFAMVARKCQYVSGVTIASSGYACVCYTRGTYAYTISIVQGLSSIPDPTDSVTYVPLYYFSNDLEVASDYRGITNLQVWE